MKQAVMFEMFVMSGFPQAFHHYSLLLHQVVGELVGQLLHMVDS